MFSIFSTQRLARFSARRRWWVVGAWAVLLLLGGFLASGVGDVLTTDRSVGVDTDSRRADRLIEERLRAGEDRAYEQVIVRSDRYTVDDPEFRAKVDAVAAGLRHLDGVESAVSYYESGDESLVSPDRRTTIVRTLLAGSEADAVAHVEHVVDFTAEATAGGFEVLTAGAGSIRLAWLETAEKDMSREFTIGIPAAIIILIIVFGAVAAAGIPVTLAILAIIVSVGITAVVGRAFELSHFVMNMIAMMGMALGIDYSLFVVERFREERRRGVEKITAVAVAGGSAGRAVLFAGVTVIVALSGLFIVPDSIFRSLAAGAIVVAAVSVLAALTLLPAVLSILGDRVDALRVPFLGRRQSDDAGRDGAWAAIARGVMGRPVLSIAAAVGVLGAMAVPYFNIELGTSGASTLPKELAVFRAFDILNEEFSAGMVTPVEVVVDARDVASPEVQAAIGRLQARLASDEKFGDVAFEVSENGDLLLMSVELHGDAQANGSHAALERLRGEYIPAAFAGTDATVLVTGETAWTVDYNQIIRDRTPYVFAFVLGISFIVLLIVFRSIVVPVKAILMNLLSVGAAYGALVLVFQHGVGNEIFGFQQVERIEAWLPLFLFAILFGLSMDYHVFLLSRIRERFDESGDNRSSVAFGVRSTAGIITGAAAIMVAVFSGFALGDLAGFQQMGFGLAVAVILDATVVRSVLVPASMSLLGRWNWYLPPFLEWLPTIRVEGSFRPQPQPVPVRSRELGACFGK